MGADGGKENHAVQEPLRRRRYGGFHSLRKGRSAIVAMPVRRGTHYTNGSSRGASRRPREPEIWIAIMADHEIDVRGLNCPLPILKTKKAINTMESGQTVRVLATDRGAMLDFKAFSAQTGHELLESSEADGVYTFVIRKT